MRRRVAVLGDVAVDVVVHLAEPIARGSDTGARVHMTPGGSGANVAWWLARAGVAVTLLGRVGDDGTGRAQVAALDAAGVDVRLAVDAERPTGVVVVIVEPGGERTMLPDRGANLALAAGDVPRDVLAGADHLHLSGYALLDEGPRAAALEALEAARAGGATVSVNPASARPLERAGPGLYLAWTAGADLSIGNLDEARLLTGSGDPDEAARALGGHYGAAVVTLGDRGSVWSDGAAVWRSGTAATQAAVDSTGAGDAFTAGLLAAWLEGETPGTCLARGAALAALAVTAPGARPV